MQSVKAPRSSSKTRATGSPSIDYQESGPTFKASLDDLRRPGGRESLRNHFSGAFPETQPRPALASSDVFDSGRRTPLARSASHKSNTPRRMTPAPSAPSAESLAYAEAKRLSTVREQHAPMEVAQAIQLLEEIKKTATAAELVALHKALLPSRSPQLQDDQMPNIIRRTSMLPPGLATRDASGDLLQTPEEAAAEARRKRRPSAHQRTMTAPVPAVNDQVAVPQPRSFTPDYERLHMGAYTPGTLRITNGTATPPPGISRAAKSDLRPSPGQYETTPSAVAQENGRHESRLESATATSVRSHHAPYVPTNPPTTAPQSADTTPTRGRRASEPARSGIPVPESKDDSAPRLYRPARPESRSQSRSKSREVSASRPRLVNMRTASNSQLPRPVNGNPAEQQPAVEITSARPPLRVLMATEVARAESISTDDTSRPPSAADFLRPNTTTDIPRFAQRLSYRMSHIPPQEPGSNLQLPANPDESSGALSSLAHRLSSYSNSSGTGNEQPTVATPQSPEEALARLNGFDEPGRRSAAAAKSSRNRTLPSQAHAADLSSPEILDSGYGSEIPNSARRLEKLRGAGLFDNAQLGAEAGWRSAQDGRECLSAPPVEVSPHSFRQVLNPPQELSGPATTPSSPSNPIGRKRLSLLGIQVPKKGGTVLPPAQSTSPHADPVVSPDDRRFSKSPANKLQKALPASVKRELKAQRKKQAERNAFETGVNPQASQDLQRSSQRRPQGYTLDPRSLPADATSHSRNASAESNNDIDHVEASSPIAASPAIAGRRQSVAGESQKSGSTIVPRGHPNHRGHSSFSGSNRSGDMTPRALDLPHASPPRQGLSSDVRDTNMGGGVGGSRDKGKSQKPPRRERPTPAGIEDGAASESVHSKSRDLITQGGQRPDALKRSTISVSTSAPTVQQPPAQVSRTDSVVLGSAGYSTESVADAIKRAMEDRERARGAGHARESVADAIQGALEVRRKSGVLPQQEKKRKKKRISQKPQLPQHASEPYELDAGPVSLQQEVAELDAHPPTKQRSTPDLKSSPQQKVSTGQRSTPERKIITVQKSNPELRLTTRERLPVEPKSLVGHPETTVPGMAGEATSWEEQAKAWRQRRRSMRDCLSKISEERSEHSTIKGHKRASTTSIASICRKPLPPLPLNTRQSTDRRHQRNLSAEVQAELFRDMASRTANERPSYDGIEWRDSTGTFGTVTDEDNDNRVDSAVSSRSGVSSTSVGANFLPTATHQPHSSTDSTENVRQARSYSLARLTGTPARSSNPSVDLPRFQSRSAQPAPVGLGIGRYSGGVDLGHGGEGYRGSAETKPVGERTHARTGNGGAKGRDEYWGGGYERCADYAAPSFLASE